MTILWSNNASTTVSGSITAVSTTVALAAGTGVLFPSPTGSDYYVATFYDQATKTQNEIVHVTAMAGDIATIVRAQEGTTAKAWNAGDIFANLVTAGTLRNFVQSGAGPASTSIVYVGTDVSTTPGLIVCNTVPVPANYAVGMLFNILVKNTNLGPVQCQFNGLAAVTATRTDGSPMVGGNVVASEEMIFIYNGVNFTSMVPPIPQQPPQTVFYVRPDGNDNNSGFANTPTSAFLTISGAMYQIKQRYISQLGVTIRVADGTYIDAFTDSSNYIASWSIIGNTANPGNCVINSTSVNPSAYPPHASIARCCVAGSNSIIGISGFLFQSYFDNVAAAKGMLIVSNCDFTSPTSSSAGVIFSNSSGTLQVYGTCQFTGTTPVPTIFVANSDGVMRLGWHDGVTPDQPLTFNIAAGSVVTNATAESLATATFIVHNSVITFSGVVPACAQFNAASAGGFMFQTGSSVIFPGTLPGVVTAPGWIG
jgi:hypothetical protein